MDLSSRLVRSARSPSPWNLGNSILYNLCRAHPGHSSEHAVIAKLWLIGRSYAAAIERRRSKAEENDDFYIEVVAPRVKSSGIDDWLRTLTPFAAPTASNFEKIVFVHGQVTALFESITGLEKRSLASKYLHFHLPHLFFIYDARAAKGLRRLGKVVGRASSDYVVGADNEYRKFFEKCLRLRAEAKRRYGASMSPREIDNLLLQVSARVV